MVEPSVRLSLHQCGCLHIVLAALHVLLLLLLSKQLEAQVKFQDGTLTLGRNSWGEAAISLPARTRLYSIHLCWARLAYHAPC